MKKVVIILLISMLLSLAGCGSCEHVFVPATCSSPATCSKCGETQGEPIGHDWVDATCTQPKTCLQCGITTGEKLGHKANQDATCTTDSICTVCGAVIEKALGHNWKEATCISPQTCSICGLTEGEISTEHSWIEATCLLPRTCSICELTEGKALGHEYAKATCTEPKTCTRCGETVGEANGHKPGEWEVTVKATKDKAGTKVQKCRVCGEKVASQSFRLTDKELLQQYKKSSYASYDDLARSPDRYKGSYVYFTGKVLQVCSEASSSSYYSVYRVATSGSYNDVVLVYIDNYGDSTRILEDDTITFYGKADGLYTYTTVLGASMTIPSVKAEVYYQGYV